MCCMTRHASSAHLTLNNQVTHKYEQENRLAKYTQKQRIKMKLLKYNFSVKKDMLLCICGKKNSLNF